MDGTKYDPISHAGRLIKLDAIRFTGRTLSTRCGLVEWLITTTEWLELIQFATGVDN